MMSRARVLWVPKILLTVVTVKYAMRVGRRTTEKRSASARRMACVLGMIEGTRGMRKLTRQRCRVNEIEARTSVL